MVMCERVELLRSHRDTMVINWAPSKTVPVPDWDQYYHFLHQTGTSTSTSACAPYPAPGKQTLGFASAPGDKQETLDHRGLNQVKLSGSRAWERTKIDLAHSTNLININVKYDRALANLFATQERAEAKAEAKGNNAATEPVQKQPQTKAVQAPVEEDTPTKAEGQGKGKPSQVETKASEQPALAVVTEEPKPIKDGNRIQPHNNTQDQSGAHVVNKE